jgi:pyruvate dehydrogenase E1 component alpha subunit
LLILSATRGFATEEESRIRDVHKAQDLGGGKYKFTLDEPFKTHKCDAPEPVCFTTKEELLHMFKQMVRIRRTETEADKLYKAKEIRGFLHLYSGQEAVAIGMEGGLTWDDCIITAYRDHGHLIARGGSPKDVLAELLGKATGCSKGKGGSMHMYRVETHFFGGNGIVGAQVPVGAGLALSQKLLKTGKVSVSLYGDGAANQGQIFEAFNMAYLWKLPAIFVCENNKYGMGTAIARASASTEYYKRGDYIPGILVNGMDVLAVKAATLFAADWARTKGPMVMEMETYRYSGHSMSDPGITYRTREEIQEVRRTRDPIERMRYRLLDNNIATQDELKAIEKEAKDECDAAVKFAQESPFLPLEATYQDIFVEDIPARATELVNSYYPGKKISSQ